MARQGLLDEKSAARQLLAAAVLDLMVLYLLVRIALPLLPDDAAIPPKRYHGIALFAVLIPVWWALTDVGLAGRSPGRMALGLSMATATGQTPPLRWRVARLTGKMLTLGLGGLRLDRLAGYDRMARISWLSPLSAQSVRPVGQWSLRFLSGPIRGGSMRLDKIPGFSPQVPLRIGRDPSWAMLRLKDPRVSGHHCEIDFASRPPRLRDLGSQNGTFVDGKRIAPQTWVSLETARTFAVAGQVISLAR